MSDKTQGSAKQKDPGAGSNPQATAEGAARAPAVEREQAAPQTQQRTRRAAEADTMVDDRPTAKEIAKREPVTYRALDRGYVDGKVVEPGEIFATQADPGKWMEKVKASAKADYTVEMAVDEAQMGKKVDVDLEGMSKAGLEVMAALAGVSRPGELDKDELITAIRAKREINAQ